MDKDLIILELNARWKWRIPFGWIPISGNEAIENTEIYHADYFDIFEKEIINTIGRIYSLTEVYELVEDGEVSIQPLRNCTFFYDGLERMYTDKDFQFALYFSHETSVTVGGRQLLEEIHIIWPEHKNHFWQADYWNYPPDTEEV
ncbi:hypothetical protein ACFQ48_20695 [Hymenobacter caeli]|uniref:Uncharacterized protein n=1 Tax=Hymenobacter caeli TaxID=2735894 RepID=A0ABX2FWJ0_9BACT|nr:hypothetical protein [Hymenobacter caeli]NRT21386.1 hypothetical protein [Hymenobacter caeli]